VHPPLHTLKIWAVGSTPRGARRPSLSVCLFFCPSRYIYDARHRKPRRRVYVLNLGGTGIRPPDSCSYRSNFRYRSRSSSCSTTSGDIFYCSGSRQLNHFICYWCWCCRYQICDMLRLFHFITDRRQIPHSLHIFCFCCVTLQDQDWCRRSRDIGDNIIDNRTVTYFEVKS